MESRPIKDIVKGLLESLKTESPGLTRDDIAGIWESAAGKKFARHSRPVYFKSARLIVNVDSSGWLYELTLRQEEILGKLKRSFKEKKLEKLQFRIGEV